MKKRECRKWKFKKSKGIYWYTQTIDDFYKKLEDYNWTKKTRALIVFDGMIAGIESNKKFKS